MKYPCKYYHVPEHLKPYGSVQPPTTPKPPKVDRTIQLCKRFSHMACTFNDCKFWHPEQAGAAGYGTYQGGFFPYMAMASAPLPSGSDVTHIEVC
eukprot:CAMPEP_0174338468 /NCGR_PEP_ID=MMETSP0810-20121108/23155_1 /TAXON_ID=73025 ORGANISM="Eutreptiella gymnastica-like, Strain CCMP1594" /NCGR_SAMPLE_ID=MMETSP0810 /ASSEMBLY_ACC=CAM_ASM_000659 /LENGTH=94 /DNA_ID=CAMNT_0015458561 /DNA_START=1 /DNA_END=282 /DNA_ORIENTATION=+